MANSIASSSSPRLATPTRTNRQQALPVYDISGLTPKPFPDAPPSFLIKIVLGLRRFLIRLADRVVPADAAVFERATGIGQTQVLGAIARFRIADLLAEQAMDAETLAQRTQTNADAMHRILRAAVTAGICKLRPDGKFENNRLSSALRSKRISRTREFVEYFSSHANCAAYCAFDHVLTTGEEGFAYTNKMDLWDWFDAHPAERETFAQMMMGVTIGDTPMIAKLYPFEDISRLCDVGGGRGALLSELVIRYPNLTGVLFDREGVIESAKPLLLARGVEDRIEAIAGDFFTKVVGGCDAYLLKNVMHDWDDEKCITILKTCHKAMTTGNKMLLVEIIVEKNECNNFGSFRDIHVLTVCTGGRERSKADYQRLLEAAGFQLNRVFNSPIISVIEGIAH